MAALEASVGDVPAAAVKFTEALGSSSPAQQQKHSKAGFATTQGVCSNFMQRLQSNSSQPKQPDPVFAGKPAFSIGSLDIHAGNLVRQFRVRQKFELDDRLAASAGLAYDFKAPGDRLAPFGTLTYKLEPGDPKSKSRIELSTLDRRLLVRKGWEFNLAAARVGVSAEARLSLREEPATAAGGGSSNTTAGRSSSSSSLGSSLSSRLRPDLHISLDHVEPLKYELIGIGLVLLLGLPLKLNNKEVEARLPLGLGALSGFGRASLKRVGYLGWQLGAGEASAVLDL